MSASREQLRAKYMNNLNVCFEIKSYRKKYYQANLNGLHKQTSHISIYNKQTNWKGITGHHNLILSTNKINNFDRFDTMSTKSKVRKAVKKSMAKRTKERVYALTQPSFGTMLSESSDSDEIKSEESESGIEMETEELEEFNIYCRKSDFSDKEVTFYHTAASIYRLAGLKVAHPTDVELAARVKEACPTADPTRLEAIIAEVLLLRETRDNAYSCPQFLYAAEEWVRNTIRDDEQEMAEAYRALGAMFKLARNAAAEIWNQSGESDMYNMQIASKKSII